MVFLRIADVSARTTLKKTKVYELIQLGRFPRWRTVEGCSVWNSNDVDAWIENAWRRAGEERKAS